MTVRILEKDAKGEPTIARVALEDFVAKHHSGLSAHDVPTMMYYDAHWDDLEGQSAWVPFMDDSLERFMQIPASRKRKLPPTVANPLGWEVLLKGINFSPTADVQKHDARPGGNGMPYYLVMTVPERKGRCSCGHGKPFDARHCAICSNMLDPEYFIYDKNRVIDGFYVGPNQNPIDRNHSLLVSAERREQSDITVNDIRAAMEFSYLMQQFLIYNRPETGGTVPHLHFQGFNHCMGNEHKTPLQQLIDEERDTHVQCNGNTIEFSLSRYPGQNKVYIGADAPQKAMKCIDDLGEGALYNLFIDKDVICVIPRMPKQIKRPETNSDWAGLEMCGCIVVPDAALASKLTYKVIDKAMHETLVLRDAPVPRVAPAGPLRDVTHSAMRGTLLPYETSGQVKP